MKKNLLTSIVTFGLIVGISCPAYAGVTIKTSDENYVTTSFEYTNEEKTFRDLEQLVRAEAVNTPDPVWLIISEDNHLNSRYYISSNKKMDNLEDEFRWFTGSSVDFIQVGTLMDSQTRESIETAFESNPMQAATDFLSHAESQKQLPEFDATTPVYWHTQEVADSKFMLEVAIGKYEIQSGDCLSILAERFNTTVEQLMQNNQNITDPNLIYAGDFLVIK